MASRSILAVLATLVLLAGCGGANEGPPAQITASDGDGYNGARLDKPYVVPRIPLTDTEGRRFDLSAQSTRTLVFFGYTHCPDICQVVMSTIASALVRLPAAQRDRVQVAFVTTDPARDTRPALRTYLDRFDPRFIGLTGPVDRIDRLARPMGIFVKKGHRLASGGYEVDHTAAVISVDHGEGDLVWTGTTSPAQMAADLHKQLR